MKTHPALIRYIDLVDDSIILEKVKLLYMDVRPPSRSTYLFSDALSLFHSARSYTLAWTMQAVKGIGKSGMA